MKIKILKLEPGRWGSWTAFSDEAEASGHGNSATSALADFVTSNPELFEVVEIIGDSEE